MEHQVLDSTNEMRNILSFLCHPNDPGRCFLCFKLFKETSNIFEDFLVEGRNIFKKSMYTLMTELFSFQDILTDRVCDACIDGILNITKIMNRHKRITTLIKMIIKELNKKIDIKVHYLTNNSNRCELKLNVADFLQKQKIRDNEANDSKSGDIGTAEKGYNLSNIHPKFILNHKNLANQISTHYKICEKCGKVCKSSALLRAHMNCHRLKKCPHCPKTLKTHTHFYHHTKKHLTGIARTASSKTVYRCSDCNYTSKNKKSLEAHLNKEHLHKRPYVCEVCSKGFYKKSNLVEHKRTHVTNITEVCHICGDNFVTKKCLREHLRLHTGERPYKCDHCEVSFISSGRRSDHIKRKHKEKSELCISCGKMFALKKDLDRHTKKVHSKDGFVSQNIPQTDTGLMDDINLSNDIIQYL